MLMLKMNEHEEDGDCRWSWQPYRMLMFSLPRFMSEGFLDAKKLALKFSTLYALNKDMEK